MRPRGTVAGAAIDPPQAKTPKGDTGGSSPPLPTGPPKGLMASGAASSSTCTDTGRGCLAALGHRGERGWGEAQAYGREQGMSDGEQGVGAPQSLWDPGRAPL